MKKNLVEILKNIGISDREARVYLAALDCGSAPASEIARGAGLNRVTTYTILKKLIQRGLVSSTTRAEVQYFSALDPELLISQTRHRADELASQLPALRALQADNSDAPTVRLFEGLAGVKQAYAETLRSTGEILNYANSKNLRTHWPEYDEEYVAERCDRGIFLRGIAPDDAPGRRVSEQDEQYHRETRLLPKKMFWVENEIKIFDDTMLIASFEPNPIAILISSPAVADTQRQIFEISWMAAGQK